MTKRRSILLSLSTIVVLVSGCIFFPNLIGAVPTADSVADVAPGGDAGNPSREQAGAVQVTLVNNTEETATCTVLMNVAGQQVHFARRSLNPGGTAVIVGPDNAEEVLVNCTIESVDFDENNTFTLGQDFEAGDEIRVNIRLPEPPAEPNQPVRKPALLISLAGLDADRVVERGQSTTLQVAVTNSDDETRLSVFADPDTNPDSGNEILIVSDLPGGADNEVTWDTTGVPLGTYCVYVEGSDAERFTRSNASAGKIRVVDALDLAVDLPEPVTIELGETASFAVTSANSTEVGTIDVVAMPTEGGDNIEVASDLPPAATQNVDWDTTGVAPGTYTLQATLQDGARSTTATAVGTVTILPALEIALLDLDADVTIEVGDSTTFRVTTAGSVNTGATFNVYATALDDPNQDMILIAENLPANSETEVTWVTFDESTESIVPAGVYEITAKLTDGDRSAETFAIGRVIILDQLNIFLFFFQDTVVEMGESFTLEGIARGLVEGSTYEIFAECEDDGAGPICNIPVATDQTGNGDFSIDWDTSDVPPGTYRFRARADDPVNNRQFEGGLSFGEVTIVAPLEISILELTEDVFIDFDANVPYIVEIGPVNSPDARFDVRAVLVDEPNRSMVIEEGLPALPQTRLNFFASSKEGFDTGTYELIAELTDGQRSAKAVSLGTVTILEPLFIAFQRLDDDIVGAPGFDARFGVRTENTFNAEAFFDVFAERLGDQADPIPVALGQPADPNTDIIFSTEGLPPGRYEMTATLEDGDRFPIDTTARGVVVISTPPLLTITDPNGPIGLQQGNVLEFSWFAFDPEEDATISFFLDPDQTINGNEILLLDDVSEDDQQNRSAEVATDDVPDGDYFLVGIIDDGFSRVEEYAVDVCVTSTLFGNFTATEYPGLMTTITGVTDPNESDANAPKNVNFGYALDISRDLSGDGVNDVTIGDPFAERAVDGLIPYGAAYYHSRRAGSWPSNLRADELQAIVTGSRFDEQLGTSVALLPGFSPTSSRGEWVVGAPDYNWSKSVDDGRAFFYDGDQVSDAPEDLNAEALRLTSRGQEERLGQTVASGGDVNGDQFGDALIAGPKFDSDRGRVVVVSGASGLPAAFVNDLGQIYSGSIWNGAEVNDLAGTSLSSTPAQDPNDPRNGMIIGSPGCFNGAGGAFVVPGGDHLVDNRTHLLEDVGTIEPGFKIMGALAGDALGTSVASDHLNDDNFPDYILGAPGANNGKGRIYIIFGGPELPPIISVNDIGSTIDGVVIDGQDTNAQLGMSVATMPDRNGDGLPEMIFGAPGSNDASGAAHLLFSQPDLPATFNLVASCQLPIVTITGDFGDQLGASVSGGDVDGDGIGDLAAGAPGDNKVYIFFGGTGPEPQPCRGDLNNDGVVDLSDLSILLASFGRSDNSADINDNGTVDLSDLAILLNEFGNTCIQP